MTEIINTFVVPSIRDDYFPKFLRTLYKNTPPNFKVIWVDMTAEGCPQYANDPRVHIYIRPQGNLGFAQGMNIGLRMAQTKYVTAANDDVEFIDPRWWTGIEETFKSDPKIKGVNPLSVTEPGWGYGCNRNSTEELVKSKEDALHCHFNRETELFEHLPYKEEYTKEDYDFLLKQKSGTIDGIITWMTVFEKEALEYKGYYDERFYPGGGEDYDLDGRFYSKWWPTGTERPEDRYRVVATSRSWAWHWLGMSRSYKGPYRPMVRPSWNKGKELWEDNWSHPTQAQHRKDKVFQAEL